MNRLIGILGLAMLPALSFGATGQKSTSYEFEYTAVSASGSVTQAGNYSMMSRVSLKGIADAPAGSASYSVEPLIGAPAANSRVSDWSIY